MAKKRGIPPIDRKGERGYALAMVLVFMMLGGLIIAPFLGFMSTGHRTGVLFEDKTRQLYAADAGIEDGKWHITYDKLYERLPGYDLYDYDTEWSYTLTDEDGGQVQVNGYDVDVTIKNVWMPMGIDVPDPATARQIIEDGTLIITGGLSGTRAYELRISWGCGDGAVETIGIWLPPGFEYDGECSLEGETYYSEPAVIPHKGGNAVVWSFFSPVSLGEFPGSFTFKYSGPDNQAPGAAISWIVTTDDFAWDADTRIYRILSEAGDTKVEAYVPRGELRQLGSAIAGNYFATGNSLIGGNYMPPHNYHYELYRSTSRTITTSEDASSGIPESAIIQAAYLYWTGWIDWNTYNPSAGTTLFYDSCSNFNNWIAGSRWTISSGTFRGQAGDTAAARTLTMATSVDLSGYSAGDILVSWRQRTTNWGWYSGALRFYFSGDGGLTWSSAYTAFSTNIGSSFQDFSFTIPEQYLTPNFRMRFLWDATSCSSWSWLGCPYVFLDDITVVERGPSLKHPDNATPEQRRALVEEAARVHRVLFNDTPVTADAYQTLYPDLFATPPYSATYEGTWFYTAMADVTNLLRQWVASEDIAANGAGDYTLGHYYVGTDPGADDFRENKYAPSYRFTFHDTGGFTGYPLGTPSPSSNPATRYTAAHAGWSLLIIYTSPETLGHQLYLYDIQNPNFDFFFGWHSNADFNNDGSDGGSISGFLVPDPVTGEMLAGRITVMVGEGDRGYSGDYFIVNGVALDDGGGYGVDNVWNGVSPGMTVEGLDIDTFEITWASGILSPGDTSVQVDIPTFPPPGSTTSDGFTMVYMILSFRSETTTGGSLSYLIR